jgi:hypothetical protein
MSEDFHAIGHLSRSVFDEVCLPREADVYLCGPTRFMAEMKDALATLDIEPERIHVELFSGSESMTPGVVGAATRAPHLPKDDANTGPMVSFARSGIAAHWKHPLTRAFWNWPRLATSRCVGRAGPVFAATVRAVWFRGRSSTDRSHSKSPLTATFSYAAHNRLATSLSICEA